MIVLLKSIIIIILYEMRSEREIFLSTEFQFADCRAKSSKNCKYCIRHGKRRVENWKKLIINNTKFWVFIQRQI